MFTLVLVNKKLERFKRDFLCEGVDEGKRSHLVSWDMVSRPLDLKGLRVCNLRC